MGKEILTIDQTPHERKKAYLREIIKRGIYRIKPEGLSAQQWSMRRKIGFQYALTDKTFDELGQQYGVSGEDVRQLNHGFLDNIHQISPPKLQAQYPRGTIPDRKPWTQKSRERNSAARGGLSLKVKWLIEQGITDSKQTMDILGISARDLTRARRTLRRWGINVPQTFKSRKEIFTIAHQRKLEFLRERIKEGVNKILPDKPGNASIDAWSRQRKVGFRYAFQDNTLEEIGRSYGITRQRAGQLNEKFLPNIWHTASPKLRKKYPLETLPLSKPLTQRSREKLSESFGGSSFKIKKLLVERGMTDPVQIQAELGISPETMRFSRKVLKEWGIELPRTYTNYMKLKEMIVKETDDEKLQKILDSLSDGQIRGYLERCRKSGNAIFIAVSRIVKEAGHSSNGRHTKRIVERLENAEIPVRTVTHEDKRRKTLHRYWVVFAKHRKRIVDVLNNDQDLKDSNAVKSTVQTFY